MSEKDVRETRFGYLHSAGLIVLSTAWFIGVHRIVQAIVASCNASAGFFVYVLVTMFVGWLCFTVAGLLAFVFFFGWARRVSWPIKGLVVILWLSGVSWAYLVIATSTLTDPVLMSIACRDGAPTWWPTWIPL